MKRNLLYLIALQFRAVHLTSDQHIPMLTRQSSNRILVGQLRNDHA